MDRRALLLGLLFAPFAAVAKPVVNVKWFGAIGDGITDDRVAITYRPAIYTYVSEASWE